MEFIEVDVLALLVYVQFVAAQLLESLVFGFCAFVPKSYGMFVKIGRFFFIRFQILVLQVESLILP